VSSNLTRSTKTPLHQITGHASKDLLPVPRKELLTRQSVLQTRSAEIGPVEGQTQVLQTEISMKPRRDQDTMVLGHGDGSTIKRLMMDAAASEAVVHRVRTSPPYSDSMCARCRTGSRVGGARRSPSVPTWPSSAPCARRETEAQLTPDSRRLWPLGPGFER
jgi:hypothetical protein